MPDRGLAAQHRDQLLVDLRMNGLRLGMHSCTVLRSNSGGRGASLTAMWVHVSGASNNADGRPFKLMNGSGGSYLERPAPSGLADVIELILDKGIVLDAYVRISLLGIELLSVDARLVIASVDTYLRFAEATNRLDLENQQGPGLPDLVSDLAGSVIEDVASSVVENKVEPIAKPVRKTIDMARSGVEKAKDAAESLAGKANDGDEAP